MSKRIFSIMDTGKKKAGAIIICVTLIATLGTGAAFASNAAESASSAISASDNQESEPTKREPSPEYEQFGISYDEDGKMLFDSKTVRYFWDGFYVDYPSYATVYDYLNEEGIIDIHTVRSVIDNGDGSYNPHGELLDIVAYSQQEFDARDIDWLKRGSTAGQSGDEIAAQEAGETGISSVSAQSGNENGSDSNGRTIAEIMKDYEIYGIEYERRTDGSDNMGNIYYNGQLVKTFVDVKNDGGVYTFSSVDGGDISVRTVYDVNDKLTGVEITNGGKANIGVISTDSTKLQATAERRAEILSINFEKYVRYGVVYDAEQDAVFYNSERVKLFVDFKSDKGKGTALSFELCYRDENTDSECYLEVVKDSGGQITGIRPLDEEIANELLEDNTAATPTVSTAVAENFNMYLTMDATTASAKTSAEMSAEYYSRMEREYRSAETSDEISFSDMAAWWDIGWGDDEFILSFFIESYSGITRYGVKCWDENGNEIKYIDEPEHEGAQSNGYFCIEAISPDDGSFYHGLEVGKAYFWKAYAYRGDEYFESAVNAFVFSTEGTRFAR